MKLPTLWIAGAFAGGIALAGIATVGLWYCVALAAVGITAGFILLRGKRLAAALLLGLLGWVALGGAAVRIEQVSPSPTLVTRLASEGKLDLTEPLRWCGRLRSDSMRLPWGTRYEIDLESVQAAGRDVRVTGGLRVNFYNDERHPESPGIYARETGSRFCCALASREIISIRVRRIHAACWPGRTSI
jgi:hypothetical protein